MTDNVVIGKFGRPHGVHGEVRLFLYNPDSELFDLRDLVLFADGIGALPLESLRPADKFAIARLTGVDSREDAERLRNREVFVPRAALPEPDPDEFYLVDVIGFDVRAPQTTGAEAALLGKVKGWLDIGPNDIMAVTGPDIRGRLLVPHVDHIVDRFDFETRCVHLHPLDTWMAPDGDDRDV